LLNGQGHVVLLVSQSRAFRTLHSKFLFLHLRISAFYRLKPPVMYGTTGEMRLQDALFRRTSPMYWTHGHTDARTHFTPALHVNL